MSITFDATGAIVVGTDLSGHAQAAVDWAAERAAARGLKLIIVLVLPEAPIPPRSRMFDAMATGDWVAHLNNKAQARLDGLRVRALEQHPDLEVETRVEQGMASYILAQATKKAEQVVVGARGENAPARVRALGGTSDAVVQHSHGPVVVVNDTVRIPAAGPVVVGLDDSKCAAHALELGVDAALTRGVPLIGVHAFDLDPWLVGTLGGVPYDPTALVEGLHEVFAAQVAPYQEKHPELKAEVKVVAGRPSLAILEAADDAGLIVMGSRGRGGFRGLLLGSTSKAVLREAHCPVLIVRE